MTQDTHKADWTNLATLELLVAASLAISNDTVGRPTNWRGQQVSLAFAKVGVTALTFLRLMPESSYFGPAKQFAVWDLSAAAAQCRGLIEAYYVICYLVHEPTAESEQEFRQLLWEYHEEYERHEMLRTGIPDSRHLTRVAQDLGSRRARIEANAFFQTLSAGHRQRLLDGKDFKLDGPIELSRKAGVSENYYRSNYKYCSAFAHSAPFSISQLDVFKADTMEAKQVLGALVSVSCGYMAVSIRDFTSLFPDQIIRLSPEIRQVIQFWEELLKWEKSPYFDGQQPS